MAMKGLLVHVSVCIHHQSVILLLSEEICDLSYFVIKAHPALLLLSALTCQTQDNLWCLSR